MSFKSGRFGRFFEKVSDNKEVDNDEGEVQLLAIDLIWEGLKFASSMEQHFFNHDSDTECALKLNFKICVAVHQELYQQLEKPKKKQPLRTYFITTSKEQLRQNQQHFDSNSLTIPFYE
ncbi:hypothetical protein TNCV_1204261 [Trichonephila clavipes]|nr:hypothetical protein TNCV_1204261 [Trichonephila clavipes]